MTTETTDYATGWRPSPGDVVSGKVIDIAATDGGYGVYPIVTVEVDGGGEVAVHAFHTVLRRELARRRPKVGDVLEIKYLGKQESKGSNGAYDGYRVKSDKDVVGYDWSQDLPEGSDPGDGGSVPIAAAPIPADPVPMVADADEDIPF